MNYRIALDIDGVMYDWSGEARYLLRTWFGLELPGEAQSWDWDIDEGVPKGMWRWLWDVDGGIRHGLFRHGNLVKGAASGIRQLATLGDIILVTHRPAIAIADTIAWLDGQFGRYDPYPFAGIHILTSNEPKSGINVDVLIDDKPANVVDMLATTTADAIVFDQPWNADFVLKHDVDHGDWTTLTTIVAEMKEEVSCS